MSDFVHAEDPVVVVTGSAEGSVITEIPNSDFAHPEVVEEEVKEPEEVEVVPYRASTPESDKMAVDALLKEGKITEETHAARIAEIDEIAADPTLSPQEPEVVEEPVVVETSAEEDGVKDTALVDDNADDSIPPPPLILG